MIHVEQANNAGLVCGLCGHDIRPGTVYVILCASADTGQMNWIAAHIWCDADRRRASAETLRRLKHAQK